MLLLAVFLIIQSLRIHSSVVSSNDFLPLILQYDTNELSTNDFVPLDPERVKRASDPDDLPSYTIPPDYEVQEDSIDHTYYIKRFYNNTGDLEKHFVNVDEMLKKKGVVGNSSHPLLSGSYRRAVGAKLTFSFPFYGHYMNNLTIATGGFIYIGDQTHNWLAATQYIAPLMANFDTNVTGSNIIFADDGEKFVVEWRKVQLREQTEEGQFTFQAILHKNGDIVYAYKDIPMEHIGNISDANHPVKVGISDAYLFKHIAPIGSSTSNPKRVIYEYHRIEIPSSEVKSDVVIFLEAQPTCIGLKTCEKCTNTTLKYFHCSWCNGDSGSFCTDEAGLHRRRQDWIEAKCQLNSKSDVCSSDDSAKLRVYDNMDAPTIARNRMHNTVETQNNGVAGLVFFLGLALCAIGWVTYAYYNPHTTSGQFLIKYRPSRWHVPNSHVRYSASSVHM
ncbi:unnamed protein product [Auanema sp. JU1783]|nr:unnamed protein product [Auanema sp. JU1783]